MPIPHLDKQAQEQFEQSAKARFEHAFRAKNYSIQLSTEFNELEQAHDIDGGYRAMSSIQIRDNTKAAHFGRGKTRGQAMADVLRQLIPIIETLDMEES